MWDCSGIMTDSLGLGDVLRGGVMTGPRIEATASTEQYREQFRKR